MTDHTIPLLLCRFCGVPPKVYASQIMVDGDCPESIDCDNAECPIMPSTGYMQFDAAVAAWNARAAIETAPDPRCCLDQTAEDCAHTPSRLCTGPRPDPRDAVIARLQADLAESTRCRDAWREKAVGYDAIAAALRAKIGTDQRVSFSRAILTGALFEAENRVKERDAVIAQLVGAAHRAVLWADLCHWSAPWVDDAMDGIRAAKAVMK